MRRMSGFDARKGAVSLVADVKYPAASLQVRVIVPAPESTGEIGQIEFGCSSSDSNRHNACEPG